MFQGAPQAEAAGSPLEARGFAPLLAFEHFAEALGLSLCRPLRLASLAIPLPFEGVHPLLDQNLGHVADRAGFLFRQGGQTLAEILGQHDLNARRLRAPAGGVLTGRHDRRFGSDTDECTKLVKGSIQQ
jgi:hypothetical protein